MFHTNRGGIIVGIFFLKDGIMVGIFFLKDGIMIDIFFLKDDIFFLENGVEDTSSWEDGVVGNDNTCGTCNEMTI